MCHSNWITGYGVHTVAGRLSTLNGLEPASIPDTSLSHLFPLDTGVQHMQLGHTCLSHWE